MASILPLCEQVNLTFKTRHIKPGQIVCGTYHGSNREQLAKEWQNFDVILTTYSTLRSEWRPTGPLFRTKWARVILDEGIPSQTHKT